MQAKSEAPTPPALITLIESVRFGVYVLNNQWQFTYINPVGEQIFGARKEDLLGKNFWKLYPELNKTELKGKFKKVLETGIKQKIKYTHDELERDFTIWAYRVDEGIAVMFEEVTEINEKNRRIEYTLNLFEGLFEFAPVGFAILDDQLRFLKVNQAFMSFNSISEEDYFNKPIRQIFPQLSKTSISQMKQVLSTKKPVINFEFSWPSPTNPLEIRDFVISYYPVKHPKTEVTYLGVLVRDISERKRVDRKLAVTQLNLSYLLEATQILSTSLDYRKTLNSLADLVVPQLADWCVIEMVNEKKETDLVAVAHQDKSKVKWARELRSKYPPKLSKDKGIGYVIATSKSLLIPQVNTDVVKQAKMTKREQSLIEKLGFHSVMIVPILIDNAVVGVITFVSAESKRIYDVDDLDIAQELANRASLSIENARLYDQVRAERRRLNDLLANVPGVVWEAWGSPTDEKQQINFVSKYVEEMLGYTQEEWLGNPNFWLDIVYPEDKKRAAAESKKIFESGDVGISQFRWVKKDGTPIWVEAQSQAIVDSEGRPIGMRGVTMDITERKEQESRKDEFISMASHELKTPLTTEKLLIQLLERKVSKNGQTEYLSHVQKISAQIDRMTRLVDDLLDVSRINANRMQLNFDTFDLESSITELVNEIQQTTSTHTIEIKGKLKDKVYGDQDRLLQVVTNLLTNAIKYSPNADRVLVELKETKTQCKVSVTDFGLGIPKKDLVKIFDRFYRVNTKEGKAISGMGVGLYISAEIVRRHGGRIVVDSQVNKGSTFTIILPKKSSKK